MEPQLLVLVLRDLADELATVAAQAGNDVVDVVDGNMRVAAMPLIYAIGRVVALEESAATRVRCPVTQRAMP